MPLMPFKINEQQQFWELDTRCLIVDKIVPFDVYIQREGKQILWRSQETKILQEDINRLIKTGVKRVVLEIRNKDKFIEYVEPIVQNIIKDTEIPTDFKAFIVRETTNKILNDMTVSPSNPKIARRLETIVNPLVEFITSNPNLEPLRLLLERESLVYSFAPHSARTCYYTIGLAMSIKDFQIERIKQIALAALLHDIGEMLVPAEIREKIGEYTEQERRKMQRHPIYSTELINRSELYELDDTILTAIRAHHELGDKTGYPHHESLFDLPLEAQVLAVTHTFESFTTERVHRKARKSYDVVAYMISNPQKFPVKIVREFIKVLGTLEKY